MNLNGKDIFYVSKSTGISKSSISKVSGKNFYNLNVISSGLTVCWDVGNASSYPGSGTILYDISGNGNDGTLVNSPSYSSGDGGYLIFDGVNTYLSSSVPIQAATNSNLQTFCSWMYGSVTNNSFFGSDACGYGQFHLIAPISASFAGNNSNELTFAASFYGGGGETDYTYSITRNTPDWNYLVIVKTAATYYDVYFNGSLLASSVYRNASTSTNLYLGQWWCYQYVPSSISMIHTYSRALSSSEITSNYNNTKSRFGL